MSLQEILLYVEGLDFLLLISFLIYVIVQASKSVGVKCALLILGIIAEIALVAITFMSLLVSGDIFNILMLFWMLQLTAMCAYRINQTNTARIIIGAVVLCAIGVYMYFCGTVVPESFIWNSSIYAVDYQLYQASTFITDTIVPFAIIYNLIISPFWLRNKKHTA